MEFSPYVRFDPAAVMPAQLHDRLTTRPEYRLMLAVLKDALDIHNRYRTTGAHPRIAADTERWLFSDDTSWPLSFVNICHALGIDVDWLRGRLRSSKPETRLAAAS